MRIRKVRARAFGPLHGEELDLGPGLNVIWGRNEAGKSCWHAAIQLGLGGIRRARGRRPKAEEDLIRRYQPWNGQEWKVQTTVDLDDGTELEITQDLADPAASRITEVATGRDRSGEFIFDGSIDGSAILGLNRQILSSTICVRQAEVLALLAHPEDLQDQLQRAAAASARDETAESALRRLEDFRTEKIGTLRRGSSKPLPAAKATLQKSSVALKATRQQHQRYLGMFSELETARKNLATKEQTHREARRAALLSETELLRRRVQEILALRVRVPNGEPASSEPLAAKRRLISETLAEWKHRPIIAPLTEGPSSQELEQQLHELPARPTGDTEVAGVVSQAAENFREVGRELAVHRDAAPLDPRESDLPTSLTPAELRTLAESLERPLPTFDNELEQRFAALRSEAERSRGQIRAASGVAAALVVLTVALFFARQSVPAGTTLLLGVVAAGWAFLRTGASRNAHEKRLHLVWCD